MAEYKEIEVLGKRMVKARKPHSCFTCHRGIVYGEMYQIIKIKSYGSLSQHSFCNACKDEE